MPIKATEEGKFELRCVSNHSAASMVQIDTGTNTRSYACKVCGYIETYLTDEQLKSLNELEPVKPQ
jgi:hypothetical protein